MGIIRDYTGIFGYDVYASGVLFEGKDSDIGNLYHSRAVVVQGDGI